MHIIPVDRQRTWILAEWVLTRDWIVGAKNMHSSSGCAVSRRMCLALSGVSLAEGGEYDDCSE
jgi:hypothetical protein